MTENLYVAIYKIINRCKSLGNKSKYKSTVLYYNGLQVYYVFYCTMSNCLNVFFDQSILDLVLWCSISGQFRKDKTDKADR